MEEQFNFDLNFDFLDASTSNVKPNATVSTNYSQTASPQVLDVETLAKKIASVDGLVLQLKTEKEERAKLQKQMQDLSVSAISIQSLYEQEKTEKTKYALLSQEFKDKYKLAESQLANKTLHFDQLSSKIEQSTEKGPLSYNELALRYHRLASCLDEDKLLNQKEKQKLQQIQEYMTAKTLTPLPSFKKKRKPLLQAKAEQRDQETQYSPEMISKSTFTDFEVIKKKLISQGTQHTWYTTTRGTNTENQNKELKTQGTQYISSTTTRSTSTSGFIKTHTIGTNFPDESTKLVEDIFNEMIYDITPLSPLAAEEIPPVEEIEMKTVGTITGLKNVRKAIDYIAPVNIKSSDSRPPSRNMYERVKNEVPFMGIPTMNSFVELGGSSSSVPNNLTELWNLLGHTFFSLLQNVNTLNSSMNLNVVNDRMRNANINVNCSDQPRNSGGGSNFEKGYFEEPCRNSSSPRGFIATTRSTATSPIAELEHGTALGEQRFGNEICSKTTISCPKVCNLNNAGDIDHVLPKPPVEIQKIILNKVFQGETSAANLLEANAQSQQQAHPMQTKRVGKVSKKKCKSCRRIRANEEIESETSRSPLELPRSELVKKTIQTCTVTTQFDFTEIKNGNSRRNSVHSGEYCSSSSDSLENFLPGQIQEKSVCTDLEKDLFGISDDELSPSDVSSNDIFPVVKESTINNAANHFEANASEADVFCKPFMPKKRKQNTIDTRMFHIEELKAAQQLPLDSSKKKSSHSKRKRSAMKSFNNFSKVRICSNSLSDTPSWSTGVLLPSVTLSDDSCDFSALVTEQSLETLDVLSHHTKSMFLETATSEMHRPNQCPLSSPSVHRKSSEAILNETQREEGTDLKVIFKEDIPLIDIRKSLSEENHLSAKSSEIPPIVQQSALPKVVPVIDVSLNKTPALKGDEPLANVVCSAENDEGKAIQNRLENLKIPQISELKLLPLFHSVGGHLGTLHSAKDGMLIDNLTGKNSVTLSKETERDFLEKEFNPSSVAEIGEEMESCDIDTFISDESSDQSHELMPSLPESKLAIPDPYSDQTLNSKNSFENLHLDENHENFQEIFHRICDEFATPERPVSAIPPCESSEAEDSFSEESSTSTPATPVQGKTKRKRGYSAVTAVKRSERLKAKNSIQEAIKYSSLKIPAIELGKYTKRKTDSKSVCGDKTEEKTLPSPKRKKGAADSECRLGFFKDLLNGETRVEEKPLTQIKPTTQNTKSESEEDTSNELIIDLQDEVSTTQGSAEDNSFPGERSGDRAPTEIIPTEPQTQFNFDECPSSPPPSDQEPASDHVPLEVTERIHKHPKTNSLMSQIIANYNHEYHKRVMDSRKELDKTLVKQLQTTLTSFATGPCDGEDVLRAAEKVCSITNCEELIAHSLISVVKTAPRPEFESPAPVPELYLSRTLRGILLFFDQLYKQHQSLRTTLLTKVEKALFSFTNQFVSLDITLNLTQFYLALIADVESPSNPARLFICKCLFFYTKKAIPMIYETLCVYPSVLPHRDDHSYDRSDALISTIQCILMNTYYDTEKCDLKAKQMFYKLRNFYNYESLKPSREEVIENLIAKLRAGRFKNVAYSFAIIGKRTGRNDIEKEVLGERLLSLANEYYQTINESTENDHRIACVLECISFVIKPFPVDTDITTYINLFSRFLNATDRQVVQEAALAATLRTLRFGFVRCFRTIYNFQPKYELSHQTKVMLRSFVYKKSLEYLKKLENQMRMLTQ